MNRDFMCGLCGLLLASAYYFMASRIQTSMLADDVGPDGLPKAYAFILGGLSLLLMVRAGLQPVLAGPARNPDAEAAKDGEPGRGFALQRAIGMGLIGIFYLVSVPYLGYPIAIAGVIAAAAAYQGGVVGWRLVATAIGGAIFLWLVFVVLLHINQPTGIWPDLIERLRG